MLHDRIFTQKPFHHTVLHYFDFRCFHLLQYQKLPRDLLAGDQVIQHWHLKAIFKSKAAQELSAVSSDRVSSLNDEI